MRNAVLSAGVVLLMLLAVSGCTAPGESIENDPVPTLRTITASEAILLTESGPTLTIIDVRRPDEYAAGHIPGAANIDISSSFADEVGNLDRDGSYLIYCAAGVRGESALKMMGDLGFTEVYNLGGGISAWQRAGGSVAR
ncbi:MAG: Thiosulfate sulfurtransferase (Modular protein) [Methanocalculus sp. 52_23]|uniref:rhodanese-like domain-containing protein n=1 Tax=Methanocalculus sp. TaxID=2004547 RepID=UPI00074A086C|nr:rhodanese-like domain-containing protein [Methanocalculus sp.]KUK70225.1 MAG: Thiosulfate sulfurtransferase (Modular protein) [Methanocalculus sp. 52_23]HIJ05954.1 rhodanese-like domain-containing protein [Methanocalculus sp.]